MKSTVLRFLHSIGLTNLSNEQVEEYTVLQAAIHNKLRSPIKNDVSAPELITFNKLWKRKDIKVYAFADMLNPRNSAKHIMLNYILSLAEEKKIIKPGSTLIEGIDDPAIGRAIAQIAVERDYKFVCSVSSKSTSEGIDILRALGAKVYVCPAHVKADDPRSFYQVPKRILEETPDSIYLNLAFNELNSEAHYKFTGPRILQQAGSKITHFIACMKTGGTISGVGKFLKEYNPDIKIIGIDPYGSVLKKYIETGTYDSNELYPYRLNFGNNLIPGVLNPEVIDKVVKVTDYEAAITTRKIAREEGFFVGYTSGAAFQGFLQMIDVIPSGSEVLIYFPDSGYDFLSKVYSEKWMEDQGFYDEPSKISSSRIEYIK